MVCLIPATSTWSPLTILTISTVVASSRSSTYFSLFRWFSTLKFIPDSMSKKSIGCGFCGKLSSSGSDSMSPFFPTFFLFFCMLLLGSLAALCAAPKMNVNFSFNSSDSPFKYYSFAVRSCGQFYLVACVVSICSVMSSNFCASSSILAVTLFSTSFIFYFITYSIFLLSCSSCGSSFGAVMARVVGPLLASYWRFSFSAASSARSFSSVSSLACSCFCTLVS